MPADYESTARALALSTSPPQPMPPSPGSVDHEQPPWSRSGRRSSAARWSRGRASTLRDQLVKRGKDIYRKAYDRWEQMTFWQKVGFYAASLGSGALGIGFMVLTGKLFIWLGPVADKWEHSFLVAFVLWLCVFFISFPPLVGWSTFGTVAGFIFGVWKG